MKPTDKLTHEGFIYRIRCIVNGRCYYGQCSASHLVCSSREKQKCSDYKSKLRGNRFTNPDLQSEWNTLGECLFVFDVLKRGIWRRSTLDEMERKYIAEARQRGENPYNRESVGINGYTRSAETKGLTHKAMVGRVYRYTTMEMQMKVVSQYQTGSSLRQVAKSSGISFGCVRDILYRQGVPLRTKSQAMKLKHGSHSS